jgi:hypothetical protein
VLLLILNINGFYLEVFLIKFSKNVRYAGFEITYLCLFLLVMYSILFIDGALSGVNITLIVYGIRNIYVLFLIFT